MSQVLATYNRTQLKTSKRGQVFECQNTPLCEELSPVNIFKKLTSAKIALTFSVFDETEKKPWTKFIGVSGITNGSVRNKIKKALEKNRRSIYVTYIISSLDRAVKFKLAFGGLTLDRNGRLLDRRVVEKLRVVAVSVGGVNLDMKQLYQELLNFHNSKKNAANLKRR